MTTNECIRQYLKSVRKKLPCSFAAKTAIIHDLKQSITESNPETDWTMKVLEEKFGTPEEICEGFSNGPMDEALRKKIRKIRLFLILSATIGILLIGILLGVVIYSLSSNDTTVIITNYNGN